MSILIILGVILFPAAMLAVQYYWRGIRLIYTIAAAASAYTFGVITALSIYEILRDDTVFMTNIHAIFQNYLFLISGAYLGNYGIYCLLERIRIKSPWT